jgi:hypothetical protein
MLEIFNHWRKDLRIRYLGLIEVRGVMQFYFHDLETNTNFHVPRAGQLRQTLAVHRQKSPNREKRMTVIPDRPIGRRENVIGMIEGLPHQAEPHGVNAREHSSSLSLRFWVPACRPAVSHFFDWYQ